MTGPIATWVERHGLTARVLHRHPRGVEWTGEVEPPTVLPAGVWCLLGHVYTYDEHRAILWLTAQPSGRVHVRLRCYRMAEPYNEAVRSLRRTRGAAAVAELRKVHDTSPRQSKVTPGEFASTLGAEPIASPRYLDPYGFASQLDAGLGRARELIDPMGVLGKLTKQDARMLANGGRVVVREYAQQLTEARTVALEAIGEVAALVQSRLEEAVIQHSLRHPTRHPREQLAAILADDNRYTIYTCDESECRHAREDEGDGEAMCAAWRKRLGVGS